MKAKSSSQMGHIRRFFHPMFANCVHFCERENFSLDCKKFAIECDWNSKNSQNVQNLGFFSGKIDVFFPEKKLGMFQNC